MAIPKLDDALNDFSAGELDPDIKRSLSPIIKLGGRQAVNWRILNSHKKVNRPGRSALFVENGRIEEIVMPKGNRFFILFGTVTGSGAVKIYNAAGTLVFIQSGLNWTFATLGGIVYTIIGLSIYIAYPDGAPNNPPQILTWDGVSQTSTWTIAAFIETVSAGGQKRTAFYRISPAGITLQPSATVGNINITFSSTVLVSGMIGTRLEFCGRQLTITGVSSGTAGTATVNEPLPPAQTLTLTAPQGAFQIGDEVKGSVSGATGIVTQPAGSQQIYTSLSAPVMSANLHVGDSLTGGTSGATGVITQVVLPGPGILNGWVTVRLSGATFFVNAETITDNTTSFTFSAIISGGGSSTTMNVQLLATDTGNITLFTTSDLVVGPSASSGISAVTTIAPQPVTVWADEVINTFRGYPASLFADQARLGFCNVPAVPSAVIWSAVGLPTDLYTGAQPDDSIFELAPDQSVIFYVIAGMESSEFVFGDRAIYYIPINQNNPLKPGSVSFNKLSDFGILPGVQPRRADQSILYVKAGGITIGAVQAPGAYYRPYVIDSVSEMHSHLFTASPPIAIAIPSGPTQFEELYIYIALANGNVVCGRYIMRNGLIEPGPENKPTIGWMPWTSAGATNWVAALQGDVIFLSNFGVGGGIVEKLDNTQYLDSAVFVNNLPAPLTPPGGKGPLYVFPGPLSTVFLIDNGTRFMGTYQVDANGFLIPQFIDGENLASPNLVAGQSWTATFEPFMPHAPPGPDNQQRTRRRKVAKGFVSVQNSTGFVFGTRRIPYYFVGEDATRPAPLREGSYKIRPLGRSFDPRLVLYKDLPGPLTVLEYGFEVNV